MRHALDTGFRLSPARSLGEAGTTPGGRLTTESGVAVSSTDRTAQGTILYTPDRSDFIRLWDASAGRTVEIRFAEKSLALATPGLASGKQKNVYGFLSSYDLALTLGAEWTNDTTPSEALSWQSGLGWVLSTDVTKLWLGLARGSGANVTEDSQLHRFLSNAQNQVPRSLYVRDSTHSHVNNNQAAREWNGGTSARVDFVISAAGLPVLQTVKANMDVAGVVACNTLIFPALDGSLADGRDQMRLSGPNFSMTKELMSAYSFRPAVGYHYLTVFEQEAASVNTTMDLAENIGVVWG